MFNLNIRRTPGLFYNYRYVCISILIVISTIFYLLLRWSILCTNIETWHHVQRACRSYKQGKAVGSLCRPLCETHDIQSLRCHSFRQGKAAVFSAEWHRTRLVFKTSRTILNAENLHWYDNGVKVYPTESDFQALIRGLVFAKFNMTISRENAARLSRLKPVYEERDVRRRQREMDNVWSLLQGNEYLLTGLYTADVPKGTFRTVEPSRSGNSTIVRLLFRFYDVKTDAILVEGQNIKTVTQQSLRRAIGVVPQDTVLFNNTIKYNIWYGRFDATDAEVIEAAKNADIHERILTVPEGYDTYFLYCIHVFSSLEYEIFRYTLDQLRPPTPVAMLPGQKM